MKSAEPQASNERASGEDCSTKKLSSKNTAEGLRYKVAAAFLDEKKNRVQQKTKGTTSEAEGNETQHDNLLDENGNSPLPRKPLASLDLGSYDLDPDTLK